MQERDLNCPKAFFPSFNTLSLIVRNKTSDTYLCSYFNSLSLSVHIHVMGEYCLVLPG